NGDQPQDRQCSRPHHPGNALGHRRRGNSMNRRLFIAGLSAAVCPLAARAQQQALPVVGYVSGWAPGDAVDYVAAFRRGLAETGHVEGLNVAVEFRFADYHFDKLPALVTDLVKHRVAVIAIPDTTASSLAAKAATQTIPIVFGTGSNPV